jgi:hypothetical protein
LLKASVSEVAANTTTVPVTFPAAEALPDAAALLAADVLPDAVVLLEDELHAPSAAPSTATDTPAKILKRRRGGRERDERLTPVLPSHPADGILSLMAPPTW